MAPKQHSELPASGAYRWTACPGSIRLSKGLVDVDTEYSKEGTAAHAMAERILKGQLYLVEDPEMQANVKVFTDYVLGRKKELNAALFIEQKLDLKELKPPVPMFGTADAILATPSMLEIVDLKYGKGVLVEVENADGPNLQLMTYGLGAYLALRPVVRSGIKTIRLTVVQPRIDHADGHIRSVEVGPDTINVFAGWLMDRAKHTQEKDAPLVPGKHCRFCKAEGHCPALKEQSVALAQVEFEAMPMDLPPEPEMLPLSQVADILSKAPVIENWLRALRARLFRELAEGKDVPGFKLVMKRGKRVWADTELAKTFFAENGVTPEEMFEPQTLKSPAQMEKVVGKAGVPNDLYITVSSGATLVPSNDRRPAIAAGAQDTFAALPPGDGDSNE